MNDRHHDEVLFTCLNDLDRSTLKRALVRVRMLLNNELRLPLRSRLKRALLVRMLLNHVLHLPIQSTVCKQLLVACAVASLILVSNVTDSLAHPGEKLFKRSTTSATTKSNPTVHAEDFQYFMCFTSDGQKTREDTSDSSCTISGLAGTSVLTSKDQLRLLCGTMMIETGNKPASVTTASRKFDISPNSRAVVEQDQCTSIEHTGLIERIKTISANIRSKADALFCGLTLPRLRKSAASQGTETPPPIGQKITGSFANRAKQLKQTANTATSLPCRVLAIPGSVFSVSSGKINVTSGACLVDTSANTTITTPYGEIRPGNSRSIASLHTIDDCFCIENLNVPDALTLAIKGTTVHLPPGTGATVKTGVMNAAAFPSDGLIRRNFAALTNGGISVVTAEFLTASLLRSNSIIRRAINSPATPYQSKLAAQLLKGAAALQIATAARGAYVVKPEKLTFSRLGAFMDPIALKKRALTGSPRT